MRQYYVYIMSSHSGVIYIGMTNDLIRRVWEHKEGLVEGFSRKYEVKNLVYYEITTDVNSAIAREKQLKNWRREKKECLINQLNSKWCDLYSSLVDSSTPPTSSASLGMTAGVS